MSNSESPAAESSGSAPAATATASPSATAASELVLVLSTFPNADEAGEVAFTLVAENLAACVNIVNEIRSVYRWKAEIVSNSEVLCVIKTQRSRHAALIERLAELHPYEVPELVTLSPAEVNASYLRWVLAETDPSHPPYQAADAAEQPLSEDELP